MRRLLAILLLCVLGLPMATPLFAATASQDAGLPACCRRNGAHHCFMRIRQAPEQSQGTHLNPSRETCPAYPAAATTSIRHNDTPLLTATLRMANLPSGSMQPRQLSTSVTVTLDRSRHERGPPSLI